MFKIDHELIAKDLKKIKELIMKNNLIISTNYPKKEKSRVYFNKAYFCIGCLMSSLDDNFFNEYPKELDSPYYGKEYFRREK